MFLCPLLLELQSESAVFLNNNNIILSIFCGLRFIATQQNVEATRLPSQFHTDFDDNLDLQIWQRCMKFICNVRKKVAKYKANK